jgi:hypothetical protein
MRLSPGGRVTLARPLRNAPAAVVGLLATVYLLTLTAFSLWAHEGLRTQMDDLGNMAQAVWSASRGDWLMTQSNDVDGVIRSRLGVHANFIFWFLTPIYRLSPDPRTLLVLGSIACAAAGVGLYLFARRRLGDRWAAVLAPLAFWVSPLVHDANLYDFHVVTIVAALLVWMVWAFDSGRRALGWALLAAALLCQEHVAAVTAAYGLYQILSGRRRQGALVVAVSAAWAVLTLGVVIPLLNGGQTISKLSGPDNRYRWLLDRPAAVPWAVLQPERLRLPLYLLLGGGLVSLRQWRFLLLLVPGMAGALLAVSPWMSRLTGTYYWVAEEAVIVMAAVLASERLGRDRLPWPLVTTATAAGVWSFLLSPLPHSVAASWENHDRTRRASLVREVARSIPAEAELVVQNNLGPQVAQRSRVERYPRRLGEAQYALFYLRHVGGPDLGLFVRPNPDLLLDVSPAALVRGVRRMLLGGDWRLLAQRDGLYLLRRGAGPPPTAAQVDLFERDTERFGDEVRRAESHRRWWASWLDGPLRWEDLRGPAAVAGGEE